MAHQALYRKWRPQVFEDLVGQENISRTLINAINTNRVTHAYLFCGSRGTGKTTSARLLAKSLNCEARVNGSPCNKCGSCLEQANGSALDVIEIDAASNRGISEIKSLIEQVRFASVSGKYKVYIIDEFHMLTTEAFNAILKTLEEPPEKVVFVLATTEAHKILPTIISRCQRFDFQRIPVSALIGRLRYISDQEGIIISDDSLLSIARKANGGLRDALSLLDQISSFSTGQGEVATELVYQVLGMVSTDFLTKLAEAIAASDPLKIIETLNELVKAGNDPVVIMTETITFFRHLLIVKSSPEMAEYLEVPVSSIESFKKTGELFSKDDILECLGFLNEAIERVKKTQMAQLWLEVNFVQLCKKKKNPDVANNVVSTVQISAPQTNNASQIDSGLINDLINKINFLENKVTELSNRPQVVNNQSLRSPEQSYQSGPPPASNTNPITNIHEYKASAGQGETNNGKPANPQTNLAHLWERIKHETKKKSIGAEAVLAHGEIYDCDDVNNTVTVRFENQAYIEIMKKAKFEKVEQALQVIFGKQYKLLMEKSDFIKEEKKNIRVDSQPINQSRNYPSTNTETPEASEVINYQSNVSLMEAPNNPPELSQVIAEMPPFSVDVEVKQTEDRYLVSGETLIKPDNNVKEIHEEYSLESDSFNVVESSYEEQFKKKNKDNYFLDVANTFKGKIINKSNKLS